MNARVITLLAAVGLFGIGNQDEPGWLSTALASTDPDVDAAIEAYEAGELDNATERLDAAVARRGERAELYYDRGLLLLAQADLDAARAAFEHGTESSELQVRASSHYELGNLAMAALAATPAESAADWQPAIDAYIECLRVQPGHENAKWNLELALQRKAEQEEKDKQEQEEQDKQDEQDKEEGEEGEDGEKQEGEDGEQDKQEGEDGEQDKQEEPEQPEGEDGEQDKPEEPEQPEGEQEQPEPQAGEEQEATPQPIDSSDLDTALDELDRQDAFMFGRPRGSKQEVEKDW